MEQFQSFQTSNPSPFCPIQKNNIHIKKERMEKRKGLLRILQRSRAQNDDREMMCRRTENREAEKAERETERGIEGDNSGNR